MKIEINTDVLAKYHYTLGEFLILLEGFYSLNHQKILESISNGAEVGINALDGFSVILSNEQKDIVSRILTESNIKVENSKIDYETIAYSMSLYYPEGNKPGTTYPWVASLEELAQKLRMLVALYNFTFTEEEAVKAVKDYVSSCKDFNRMKLLKYFILKTNSKTKEANSLFMTIIENNRDEINN